MGKFNLLILASTLSCVCIAQEKPFKALATAYASDMPEKILPETDGFMRDYIIVNTEIIDANAANDTLIRLLKDVLVMIEGNKKNGKREGIFRMYFIDSIDHSIRYLMSEQPYTNDLVTGRSKWFMLNGTIHRTADFINDTVKTSSTYWLDGKTVIAHRKYFNTPLDYLEKSFLLDGTLRSEAWFKNGLLNGESRYYFENGAVENISHYVDNRLEGPLTWFYENGQKWAEFIYKNDQIWTVISNYDKTGKKRNGGDLKNGTGTVVFYNDDGTIRQIQRFFNGVLLSSN